VIADWASRIADTSQIYGKTDASTSRPARAKRKPRCFDWCSRMATSGAGAAAIHVAPDRIDSRRDRAHCAGSVHLFLSACALGCFAQALHQLRCGEDVRSGADEHVLAHSGFPPSNGAMVEPVRHRRTKGAATDMCKPKATASHLDATVFRPLAMSDLSP
jgi:hypothetical protein